MLTHVVGKCRISVPATARRVLQEGKRAPAPTAPGACDSAMYLTGFVICTWTVLKPLARWSSRNDCQSDKVILTGVSHAASPCTLNGLPL